MFDLTQELAGMSLVIMLVIYIVAFAFQLYMLYLNWKQSKVKETTTELLAETKKTNKLLEQLVKKKK